jgi:hypothetical protein
VQESLLSHAADIMKFTSSLSRGSAILNDAGRLTLTSKRYFQNVNSATFPSFAPLALSFSNNTVDIIDGFVFLQGSLYQNQTSFPGNLKFANASNQTVASMTDAGALYLKSTLATGSACTSPPYEPNLWNNDYDILLEDNCYNYGNNQITYTFAQPGRASGKGDWMTIPITVSMVKTDALSDGITWVGLNFPGSGYTCPNGGHLIFAAVDIDGKDYHWYRRDNNTGGKWSHKPGNTAATDVDASGNQITNPLTANRNYVIYNYSQNAGFYCTCGNNANVR